MSKIIDKYKYLKNSKIKNIISLSVTLCMLIYNEIIGIYLSSSWNITISIYFFFLFINRLILFTNKCKSKKINIIISISLAIESIFLIGPIILMLMNKKTIKFSTIFAITMATYTTYKVVLAILNYTKNKKEGKLQYTINLIDAIVSILNLQYALIHVFSNKDYQEMWILMIISSVCFYILIMYIVIKTLNKEIKKGCEKN